MLNLSKKTNSKYDLAPSNLRRMVSRISRACKDFSELSEKQIQNRSNEIRDQTDETSNSLVQSAALVIEAVSRTQGFSLYPVQILGMIAAASGKVIQMQTGEGKTVVTGAAAAMSVLQGRNTHVATTNDYLAARDFENLQPTFDLLGIKASLLPTSMEVSKSQAAYRSDIVYGPGYQFGFDFLLDQISLREMNSGRLGQAFLQTLEGFNIDGHLLQSADFDTVIVDEADSVLVDEATTPLLMSFGTGKSATPKPFALAKVASQTFERQKHFKIDERLKSLVLTEKGKSLAQQKRPPHLELDRPWEEYVRNALHANHLLLANEHYVVRNDEIHIVDQFTGRIFEDRTWQSGLHQAVESKENVTITAPRTTKARITRQRFIQFYDRLCGLSGTAVEASRDFNEFYDVTVFPIATHRKCLRKLLRPRLFRDEIAKVNAIVEDVASRHKAGQPVMVGTQTIQQSFFVQDAFEKFGLPCVLLNGLQDQNEAQIVSRAGVAGAITIATNMAGRGTDIKLSKSAKEQGGLHVVGYSPNHSARIDRQLIGRAGRQGQPGSAQFFVSATDDLIEKHAPGFSKQIAKTADRTGETKIDGEKMVSQIQQERDRIAFRMRQEMVMQDNWMDSAKQTLFGETAYV